MPLLARAWIGAARARRRWGRTEPAVDEGLLRSEARGRSVVDVGCMWGVDGAYCFAAEDAGAVSVTGVDLMPASSRFTTERGRRGSNVRFVHGDIHDPDVVAEIGPHDVVWCAGVLYHAPNLLTLERSARCARAAVLRTARCRVPARRRLRLLSRGDGPARPRRGVRAIGVTEPFDAPRATATGGGDHPSALRGPAGGGVRAGRAAARAVPGRRSRGRHEGCGPARGAGAAASRPRPQAATRARTARSRT